jgi:hypothetical protein
MLGNVLSGDHDVAEPGAFAQQGSRPPVSPTIHSSGQREDLALTGAQRPISTTTECALWFDIHTAGFSARVQQLQCDQGQAYPAIQRNGADLGEGRLPGTITFVAPRRELIASVSGWWDLG